MCSSTATMWLLQAPLCQYLNGCHCASARNNEVSSVALVCTPVGLQKLLSLRRRACWQSWKICVPAQRTQQTGRPIAFQGDLNSPHITEEERRRIKRCATVRNHRMKTQAGTCMNHLLPYLHVLPSAILRASAMPRAPLEFIV